MRRCLIVVAVALIIALDWAALHDIVKGNEPDLCLEYAMIILSVPAAWLLAHLGFKRNGRKASTG